MLRPRRHSARPTGLWATPLAALSSSAPLVALWATPLVAQCRRILGFTLLLAVFALCNTALPHWGLSHWALAGTALAASASTAPHTGLEGGQGRSYGPDVEKRSGNALPQTSMPMDAYGNPITGEAQDARPKVRPRAGAYGGYGKQPKTPSRPLPEPPVAPKWGFD